MNQKEEAVSPVIGVILMVAITVILAAVIAAFVIPMASNVEMNKNVAATAKQVGSDIIVTYQGGQDAGDVAGSLLVKYGTGASSVVLPNTVGGFVTITGAGNPEKDHVVVVATFTDGSEQVIYDGYV